jgi:hypothetical protein
LLVVPLIPDPERALMVTMPSPTNLKVAQVVAVAEPTLLLQPAMVAKAALMAEVAVAVLPVKTVMILARVAMAPQVL